ncbi:MAG: class I SAM-dependent DNA methyltransferase [Candidatus Hermodarchaeota archaeon]
MDFSHFDVRNYPILKVREGYKEWVETYEATVQDEMDLRLLSRLKTISWTHIGKTLDLACGTGRIGAWLKSKGVKEIDGVDITPEMLKSAKEKKIYRQLLTRDIRATQLETNGYNLAIVVLADEHIPDLVPLYKEAARITDSKGLFVIVGYHPYFLLNGLITHFHRPDGEAVGIESYIHLMKDHVKAAHSFGWMLAEMDEGIIDEEWIRKKPKWEKYLNRPVSFVMVWKKRLNQQRPKRKASL